MKKPYKYIIDHNKFEYHFTTINGISYLVSFSRDETFNTFSQNEDFNNIFQIVVTKVSPEKDIFDTAVSLTIRDIIEKFLSQELNAIIFFCSYFDKKERKRFNTFNRWYTYSELKNQISKIDNLVKIEDILLYTSLIINNNNPQKNEIVELFDSLEDVLNQEK